MQESIIHSLRSSFGGGWGQLPIGRKLIIGLAAAAIVAGIVGLALWSGKTDYSILFSDLAPEDMQAIETEMYAARVPFKYSSDGASIMVPSADVYKMRLRLASKGLPEVGAIGFEGFDKTDFGVTDFVQQLKYQRALQVELARTIAQLNAVTAARVHIVLPRETVFTENEQPAKASAVLNLRPGGRLKAGQINGIVHLIASAVEGLSKEDVTILDTSGKILSASGDKSLVDGSQLEYQRTLESELESKVRNMLEKVLGPGRATVQVAAEIDFTVIETTAELYDPINTVPKSEQTTEYTSKGMSGAPGVPGVTAGITPTAQPSGGLPEYTRSDVTTEYEVSKTIKHTIDHPGKISKLSVAVVVDNKTVNDQSVPWTQQELDDIKNLISNAVGTDVSRGDPEIEVRNIPFDTSLQQETAVAEKALKREQLRDMIMKAAIALAIAGFLIFVLRSILKSRPAGISPAALGTGEPASPLQLSQLEGETAEIEKQPKAERAPLELTPSPIEERKKDIAALAEKAPDVIAQIIRNWLSE